MLNPDSSCKIYLCTGHTDMRKGVHSLSILVQTIISDNFKVGALFVFRGKSADKIKSKYRVSAPYTAIFPALAVVPFML